VMKRGGASEVAARLERDLCRFALPIQRAHRVSSRESPAMDLGRPGCGDEAEEE